MNRWLAMIALSGDLLSAASASDASLVKFEPEQWAVGRVKPGTAKINALFKGKNNGNKAVRVEKIVASCSCVETNFGDKVLDAGEVQNLSVTVALGQKIGSKRERIFVVFSDKSYLELQISCEIDDIFMLFPPQAKFQTEDAKKPYFDVEISRKTSKASDIQPQQVTISSVTKGFSATMAGAVTREQAQHRTLVNKIRVVCLDLGLMGARDIVIMMRYPDGLDQEITIPLVAQAL